MEQAIRISVSGVELDGDLVLPAQPIGLVLFAHGSGSSRFSPRNRFVASALQSRQLATVLVDLLTRQEEAIDERTAQLRFDISLLASRLVNAIDWLSVKPETAHLPIGLFGASTGAAAAIVAGVRRPHHVAAVVSRGGRPDLAGAALADLKAPTLLIVGGDDRDVLRLNREAMARMRWNAALEVVPGATHLFEEPGALHEVARLAGAWFGQWLGTGAFSAVRGK
jgi:putative phosphoribosyl transferase